MAYQYVTTSKAANALVPKIIQWLEGEPSAWPAPVKSEDDVVDLRASTADLSDEILMSWFANALMMADMVDDLAGALALLLAERGLFPVGATDLPPDTGVEPD